MSIKEFTLPELVEEIEEEWETYNQRALDGQLSFDGFKQTRIMEALIKELARRMK